MTKTKLCLQNIAVFIVLGVLGVIVPSTGGIVTSLISLLLSAVVFFAFAVFGERKAFFGTKLFENKQEVKNVLLNFAFIVLIRLVLNIVSKILCFFFNLALVIDAVFLLAFWVVLVVVISVKNKYVIANKSTLFITLAVSFVAAVIYFIVCWFLMYGNSLLLSVVSGDFLQYLNLFVIFKFISLSALVADTIIGSMAIVFFASCNKKEM